MRGPGAQLRALSGLLRGHAEPGRAGFPRRQQDRGSEAHPDEILHRVVWGEGTGPARPCHPEPGCAPKGPRLLGDDWPRAQPLTGDAVLVPTRRSDRGDGGESVGPEGPEGGCGWAVSSSGASQGLSFLLSQTFLLKTLSYWAQTAQVEPAPAPTPAPAPAPERWPAKGPADPPPPPTGTRSALCICRLDSAAAWGRAIPAASGGRMGWGRPAPPQTDPHPAASGPCSLWFPRHLCPDSLHGP